MAFPPFLLGGFAFLRFLPLSLYFLALGWEVRLTVPLIGENKMVGVLENEVMEALDLVQGQLTERDVDEDITHHYSFGCGSSCTGGCDICTSLMG